MGEALPQKKIETQIVADRVLTCLPVLCTLCIGNEPRNKKEGGHDVADIVPNRINEILQHRKRLKAYPSSLNQLAASADVSRNTVWNLAQGIYWPKLDTAYKLARALSTTVYEIWGEAEVISFLRELSEADQQRMIKELADEISED